MVNAKSKKSMNFMVKIFISIILVLTGISSAIANSTQLPFVGTRHFNFYGGTQTAQSLTIYKNGDIVLEIFDTSSETIRIKKGKYAKLIPVGDGYYYKIIKNKIYIVDKKEEVQSGECATIIGGELRNICISELW